MTAFPKADVLLAVAGAHGRIRRFCTELAAGPDPEEFVALTVYLRSLAQASRAWGAVRKLEGTNETIKPVRRLRVVLPWLQGPGAA